MTDADDEEGAPLDEDGLGAAAEGGPTGGGGVAVDDADANETTPVALQAADSGDEPRPVGRRRTARGLRSTLSRAATLAESLAQPVAASAASLAQALRAASTGNSHATATHSPLRTDLTSPSLAALMMSGTSLASPAAAAGLVPLAAGDGTSPPRARDAASTGTGPSSRRTSIVTVADELVLPERIADADPARLRWTTEEPRVRKAPFFPFECYCV
jgi:hypothetical protein